MFRSLRIALKFMLLIMGLGACSSSAPSTDKAAESIGPPVCWFYQPVQGGLIGSVGVVRNIAVGGPKRVKQLAKQGAFKGLVAYLGASELDANSMDELIGPETDRVQVGGHSIHFVDHIRWRGYRYQYAVLDAPGVSAVSLRQRCSQRCEPSQCDPSWLCDPMTSEQAALLGVSFRATSLPQQYRLAVSNAVEQLRYFFGVQVSSKGWFYQAADSLGSLRLRVQQVDVKPSETETEDLRLLVTDSCYAGEHLFTRVASPDLTPIKHVTGRAWLNEPNQLGYKGAVGVASMTSDGLISSQIKLAVERAFGELSGTGERHISDTLIFRQTGSGRSIRIALQTAGEASISGKVMGIYFEPQDTYRMRVYVWVVEEQ